MKRKAPALRSIGIDRDRRALDGFECAYPVELIHGCAHAFLAGFPFRGTELVYSDPLLCYHRSIPGLPAVLTPRLRPGRRGLRTDVRVWSPALGNGRCAP